MEGCQQGGFGKHLIGRLTRRESFLCVCMCVCVCVRACKRGREGEREGGLPIMGQREGVSCLVEGSEMSFI